MITDLLHDAEAALWLSDTPDPRPAASEGIRWAWHGLLVPAVAGLLGALLLGGLVGLWR